LPVDRGWRTVGLVLRALPRSRTCRVAAAVVALLLTGAPRTAALAAPAHAHVCRCHHQHVGGECACACCHAATVGARAAELAARAADPSLPACHRAAAWAALERSQRPPPPVEAPCLEGSCGDEPGSASVTGVEPFVPPTATRLPFPLLSRPHRIAVSSGLETPRAPELPPPRLHARRSLTARGVPGPHSLAPWRHSYSLA